MQGAVWEIDSADNRAAPNGAAARRKQRPHSRRLSQLRALAQHLCAPIILNILKKLPYRQVRTGREAPTF